MATTFPVVEGWTSPIPITLLAQGRTPAGTMDGMSAELILTNTRSGAQIVVAGAVEITDSAGWEVTYTPDAGDLIVGSYHGRIKVTDGVSAVAYFPSGDPDMWTVRSV